MLAFCGLPLVKKVVNMIKIPQVNFSPSAPSLPCLLQKSWVKNDFWWLTGSRKLVKIDAQHQLMAPFVAALQA